MSFWRTTTENLKKLSHYLAKPHILFYALPWLMVLLVLGTIAQKNMGIYEATEKYFASLVLWIGPIPTPGGLSTLGIIFVALSIKFIFFSPWQWKKSGTILSHFGVLVLLIGSIATSLTMKEGFIIIPEGQTSQDISDYRDRVLAFYEEGERVEEISFSTLNKDQTFKRGDLKIKILEICDNCGVQAPSGKYENLKGLAVNMEPFPIADELNKEANFAGVVLNITSPKTDLNGTYILMEDVPKNPVFDHIEIKVSRAKEPLPFSITLKDFRKIDYPGTMKAQEYESDLIIKDEDIEWPATISMNQPLRYKGYVFYQSSFDQTNNNEISVLNIVENKGAIFPYISTLIIFMGLLLHFIIRIRPLKQEES